MFFYTLSIIFLNFPMKTKLILTSLTILAIVAGIIHYQQSQLDKLAIYQSWKKTYQMNFGYEEDLYRTTIFMTNLQEIINHNSKVGKTYNKAVNKFTGLTQQEFTQIYLQKFDPSVKFQIDLSNQKSNKTYLGQTIDWVSRGAVTRVKDQLSCSASYAFAAVGAIQSMEYIVQKNLTELSAQQVVDCTSRYGNNGCQFGSIVNTYAWTKQWGIQTQSFYPYVGRYQSCRSGGGRYVLTNYRTFNSCGSLHDTVFGKGPASVVINADNLKDYGYGLFSDCPTDSRTKPNYSALVVGINDTAYKLKFSLGYSFGEDGYVHISRATDNPCGICYQGSIPIIDW